MSDRFANLRAEIRDGLTAQIDPEDVQYLKRLLSRHRATDLEAILIGSSPDGNQQVLSEGN